MIKIGHNPGYWFDGHSFYADRAGAPINDEQRAAIRLDLCRRSFNMARWAGESTSAGLTVSVGAHSLTVAYLAGWLMSTTSPSWDIASAEIFGAVHDLGEMLGLGDVASPFLRRMPELDLACRQHQAAAAGLYGLQDASAEVANFVGIADRLSAVIERRLVFVDHTGDCEDPEARSRYMRMQSTRGGKIACICAVDLLTRRRIPEVLDDVIRGNVSMSSIVSGARVRAGHALGDR